MSKDEDLRPDLSVVLATVDDYRRVSKTIEHLKKQTIRNRLELVLLAPSLETLEPEEDLEAQFFAVRVVEVGVIDSLSRVKADAVHTTSADLVVFAEDHSWPEPGWAEAIVAAHRAGYAAVGPKVENANPVSTLSWANYLGCFGFWSTENPGGEVEQTPWHNTSYRRDLLLENESELPQLIAVESLLQNRLRHQGYRLFLLRDVSTHHVNISRLVPWIRQAFWGGRLYGSSRSLDEGWSIPRRALYIAAFPLLPLLRLKRLAPTIPHRATEGRSQLALMTVLMLSFVIHALGEATGYALGAGRAVERYLDFEGRRFEAISANDRARLGISETIAVHA